MRPTLPRSPSRSRSGLAAGAFALAAATWLQGEAAAQEFALYVSPPRLEVTAKAGETRRHVLELHQVSRATGRFRIYTSDWVLKDSGAVEFSEALAPGSCRPWVALERRELNIRSNGRHRFRFEVTPPADAPAQECRFAIMIEGLDTTKVTEGAFNFPVTGRIGVIVYVMVGDAAPKLAIGKASVTDTASGPVPVIEVSNSGDATGRLEGFLAGTDAEGKEIELSPDSGPILPGAARRIRLNPVVEEGKQRPALRYPLTVKGTLEWGKNRQPLDLRFER